MIKPFAFIAGAMVLGVMMSSPPKPASPPSVDEVAARATRYYGIPAATPRRASSGNAVVIDRAPDGHFYTDASVNGTTIRFMIDTGASSVALSKADAERVGLQFFDSDFTETGRGAGGDIALKPVTLDRVAVENIEATDVPGVIIAGDGNISLLGQSWLSRVGTVTIEGDQMVLR